ncbi:hypothetical protein COL922a_009846 [Colletotrichum nupharicola]|nr:hypothetical protein COL922a_009846 [Colletotrichum nupharicola]
MANPPQDFEVQVAADEEVCSHAVHLCHAFLNLVHHMCLLTLDDRLGIAPPCREDAKVGRVLDVGTGTGIWAIQFGDDHSEADILGVDLSATQPSDNLEPGGYVELQETAIVAKSDDDTLKPEHALSKWSKYLVEASAKLGAAWVDTPELRQLMVDIGFEDVAVSTYKWPTNCWPKDPHFKELGMWNNEALMTGVEAITMAPLTRALEWLPEEVTVFLIDVRKDGNDRNIHAYWPHFGSSPRGVPSCGIFSGSGSFHAYG